MEKKIQNLRPASSSFRVSVPKEKKKKKTKEAGRGQESIGKKEKWMVIMF